MLWSPKNYTWTIVSGNWNYRFQVGAGRRVRSPSGCCGHRGGPAVQLGPVGLIGSFYEYHRLGVVVMCCSCLETVVDPFHFSRISVGDTQVSLLETAVSQCQNCSFSEVAL